MRTPATTVVAAAFALAAWAPTQALAQAAAPATDLYHVHFTKAAPGQATALGSALVAPDPTAPMPGHVLVLRHQEGDDWDYAVIEHLGTKVSVDTAPGAPNPGRDLRAWHNDTFVSGPPWEEFAREMAIGSGSSGLVYVVGVHRATPSGRDALQKALTAPAPADAKVKSGSVFLQHVEGGEWTFMTLTRYGSWQDFAADRVAGIGSPDSPGGWNDIRKYSAFHRDTIADRLAAK